MPGEVVPGAWSEATAGLLVLILTFVRRYGLGVEDGRRVEGIVLRHGGRLAGWRLLVFSLRVLGDSHCGQDGSEQVGWGQSWPRAGVEQRDRLQPTQRVQTGLSCWCNWTGQSLRPTNVEVQNWNLNRIERLVTDECVKRVGSLL